MCIAFTGIPPPFRLLRCCPNIYSAIWEYVHIYRIGHNTPPSEWLRRFRHAHRVLRQTVRPRVRRCDAFTVPREAAKVTLVRLVDAAAVRAVTTFDQPADATIPVLQNAKVRSFYHDGAVRQPNGRAAAADVVLSQLFPLLHLSGMGHQKHMQRSYRACCLSRAAVFH